MVLLGNDEYITMVHTDLSAQSDQSVPNVLQLTWLSMRKFFRWTCIYYL